MVKPLWKKFWRCLVKPQLLSFDLRKMKNIFTGNIVHCSFIHKSHTQGKARCLLIIGYQGILLSNNKKQLLTRAPTWINLKNRLSKRNLRNRVHEYILWVSKTGKTNLSWEKIKIMIVSGRDVRQWLSWRGRRKIRGLCSYSISW